MSGVQNSDVGGPDVPHSFYVTAALVRMGRPPLKFCRSINEFMSFFKFEFNIYKKNS